MTQLQNDVTAGARASEPAGTSDAYAWYVVGVLILAYMVSYVDRTILTLLVKPIRETLQISDFQLSLLHGLAFAIFYTLLGIPIARLADTRSRTKIIAIGIFVWSIMTALCGLARTFGQMFMARVGVGVGEAALSPAAYSMLSDYFSGARLTRALSVYTAAIYMGGGIALILGGLVIGLVPALDLPIIGYMHPWQVVFVIVGMPGILVAALMLTIREPTRRGVSSKLGAGLAVPLAEVRRYVAERGAAYGLLIAGYSTLSLMWNGMTAWIPTFFIREFGWEASEVGLRFGLVMLVFGVTGICTGGWLSGWMRARGRTDSNVILGIISGVAMLPFGIAAPLASDATVSMVLFCFFAFAGSLPYGGAAAAFQEITPNQMRAQVSALYLFGLNLAGIGLGPMVVALFTDQVFGDDMALPWSLSLMAVLAAPLGCFLLYKAMRPYRRSMETRDF